ncbi:S-adenosylmethionine:tRNA ribosyltransferase-isomerase [Paenibacillus albiflavus]|uniref:S-adenosylmethionine:tRNA ribosyltransferase-isomerase n=1 Tax=Paenibacillus albiflavus TaxID=2545760 RepID=A0A4R4DYN6_9BACL|nr:S-adenosylmethionine:tRNA ribosyltransferase-isomerase [Paenibacillus albiflavus]TCZ70947.1 S-adenosylmethionine:tRNA ribosyltransferase-isomerase [Paenibacillus albiflavus]
MQTEAFKFELPASLNADMPPERRGIRRDYVRMMVLDRASGSSTHTSFYNLPRYINSGDLLILNSSRTVPAVLRAEWRQKRIVRAQDIEIRLARRLSNSNWEALPVAEGLSCGDQLLFSSELRATVISTSKPPFVTLAFSKSGVKLYDHIYALGEPIRYEYIKQMWDLDYYQTVFATTPGSVEMPSAGRAFSWELLFKLRSQGVRIAYLQLHTGLSYLLDDKWHLEPRDHYEEFIIPEETAEAVAETKRAGGKIIAVGTTVVRALESAAGLNSGLTGQTGWTNLQIDETFPLKIVDGLITGLHEPEASHLDLLSSFISPTLLRNAYEEAIREGYLWHEFGDMNLII